MKLTSFENSSEFASGATVERFHASSFTPSSCGTVDLTRASGQIFKRVNYHVPALRLLQSEAVVITAGARDPFYST